VLMKVKTLKTGFVYLFNSQFCPDFLFNSSLFSYFLRFRNLGPPCLWNVVFGIFGVCILTFPALVVEP